MVIHMRVTASSHLYLETARQGGQAFPELQVAPPHVQLAEGCQERQRPQPASACLGPRLRDDCQPVQDIIWHLHIIAHTLTFLLQAADSAACAMLPASDITISIYEL